MVFSGLIFLGVFLPLTLAVYFGVLALTKSFRIANKILLIASLFFYAWGEPLWICALLFTTTVDWLNGRRMAAAPEKARKGILVSSVVINLGVLFTFKYLGFSAGIANALLSGADVSLPVPSPALPIGISFYTFQSLSYVIDLYRGNARVQRNYFDYVLYVSMFPQLVAGPIVRYVDIEAQLRARRVTAASFALGIRRFCSGMGKKVLLANAAGAGAVALLDGNVAELPLAGAWLGILFFTFQIYFDFSGYSDMAIGLGRMFGFEYKENFRHPYVSTSVTEFWRRWHISLGGFFRDYVYIPLGGNRRRQLRNIFVVWLLTGLWHGASWNFILWGLYYGVLLTLDKFITARFPNIPKPIKWGCAMLLVVYGWGIFYFTDIGRLYHFTRALIFPNPVFGVVDLKTASVFFRYFWLFPIFVVGSTPIPSALYRKYVAQRAGAGLFCGVGVAAILALSFLLLVGESYNPFLYFRF